jgi:hypothetical protein
MKTPMGSVDTLLLDIDCMIATIFVHGSNIHRYLFIDCLLADRRSKYSYIYSDVIYVIYDHFSSACGLLGDVDVLSATHGDWSQEILDKHIASAA